MKIIFLDIDGVLAVRFRREDRYGSGFHPEFVENLRYIIEQTGAYIVISSTWRAGGLIKLLEMWEARNLPGYIVDTTWHGKHGNPIYQFDPAINGGKAFNKETLGSVPRGLEIDHWLSKYGKFQRINWAPEEQQKYEDKAIVKNYVILDDDSDMLLNQAEHFVKTSQQWDQPDAQEGYGLTRRAAERAIKILNSSLTELYYRADSNHDPS